MDTKISPEFWSHRDIENASPEVKLAALWLLTHSRLTLCGYAEVTEKRFAFETGLPGEVLPRAIEALPETFVRVGKGYFVPSFIARQFGSGSPLAKSHMSAAIVKELRSHSAEIAETVLGYYPELEVAYCSLSAKALGEPLARPTQGQRAEQSRVEQSRAEQSRAKGVQGETAVPADPVPVAPAAPVDGQRPADANVVLEAAHALGLPADEAAIFFDHYEANGWKQGGRTPLKSWRAALRNWARRNAKNSRGSSPAGATSAMTQPLPHGVDPHQGGAYPQT
jgi:hypothetical protein